MLSFDAQHLQSVAAGLGVEGLQAYQVFHRSTGLILPLIFAFTWWNMVRAARFELLVGRLMLTLPVAYALVFIAGGFALDLALADPLGGYWAGFFLDDGPLAAFYSVFGAARLSGLTAGER
ncbi:MAG: hypothetical protein SPI83_02410 [Rothia sp. (in: high G+C Gram-positive bacteria)]|nr:hypothetical protein [Rothia sp. (in: high G+C Gram-positive bacteria)]